MNSNGVISDPVSLHADIYPVLGIAPQGEYYDDGYACSNRHGRINMWSRYKPVRWNNKPGITDQNPQWWKAEDGKCGIGFPTRVVSYKDIPAQMTADKKNGWTYYAPDGGAFYYTVDMFSNYKHDAYPPIYGFSVPAIVSQDGYVNASCVLGLAEAPDPDGNKSGPGSIALEDMRGETLSGEDAGTLADYYLGILIVDSAGTVKGRVVGGQNDHLHTRYSAAGLYLGSRYKAYPFLAKYAMGQNDNDIMNSYITIPNTSYAEFKVGTQAEADGIGISLTAHYNYNASNIKVSITWTLKITSKTGASLADSVVMIRFNENEPLDPFVQGESRNQLGTINVGPDSPYTRTQTVLLQNTSKNYYVYGSFATGHYTTGKIQPMSEVIP